MYFCLITISSVDNVTISPKDGDTMIILVRRYRQNDINRKLIAPKK